MLVHLSRFAPRAMTFGILPILGILLTWPSYAATILDELSEPGAVIAWIGAHPDDEVFAGPLLGHLCQGKTTNPCRILTITNGANGPCKLPGGCPNLQGIRAQEEQDVATYLDADLLHWPNIVPQDKDMPPADIWLAWEALRPSLLNDTVTFLQGVNRLIILDPRHGSTCHNEHKTAALLAIDAAHVAGISDDNIYLAESLYYEGIKCSGPAPKLHWNGFQAPFPSDPAIEEFQAFVTGSWIHLVQMVDIYRSQFTYPWHVNNLSAANPDRQVVPLMRYSDVASPFASDYETLCQIPCI